MKFKKMSLLFGVLGLMFVLTACGEQDVKSGTVQVLEYDELIKKLDNEESFFLITTDAKIEDIEKTNAIEVFEEGLKKHEQGAYLVSLDGEDFTALESDYDSDSGKIDYGKYTHPKQEVAGVWWTPQSDGLAYVEGGKVVNTHMMHLQSETDYFTNFGESNIKRQIENPSSNFEYEIKEMVDVRLNNLNELDIKL